MLAAAFTFFFVPYIVEYAVNGLGEHDVDFAYCFVASSLALLKIILNYTGPLEPQVFLMEIKKLIL